MYPRYQGSIACGIASNVRIWALVVSTLYRLQRGASKLTHDTRESYPQEILCGHSYELQFSFQGRRFIPREVAIYIRSEAKVAVPHALAKLEHDVVSLVRGCVCVQIVPMP